MPPRNILTEVCINAPPEQVWDVFTNFKDYPKWQKWLAVETPNGLQEGESIKIHMTPEGQATTILTPKLLACTPLQEFRWSGRLWNTDFIFSGEHYFRLEPLEGGLATHFTHGEHFNGLLMPLLGGLLRSLEGQYKEFNGRLKERVEGPGGN